MRAIAYVGGAAVVAIGLVVTGWVVGGIVVQAIEEAAEALP